MKQVFFFDLRGNITYEDSSVTSNPLHIYLLAGGASTNEADATLKTFKKSFWKMKIIATSCVASTLNSSVRRTYRCIHNKRCSVTSSIENAQATIYTKHHHQHIRGYTSTHETSTIRRADSKSDIGLQETPSSTLQTYLSSHHQSGWCYPGGGGGVGQEF